MEKNTKIWACTLTKTVNIKKNYLPFRFGLSTGFIFIVMLLCSCSSTYYISPEKTTVVEGAPKGYVQFYNGPKITSPVVFRTIGGKGLDEQWKIADVLELTPKDSDMTLTQKDANKIGEVKKGQFGLTTAFLRVVTSPGAHLYELRVGVNKEGLPNLYAFGVNVEQDRMTPVRIDIGKMGNDMNGTSLAIRTEELPTLCFGTKSTVDSLINYLQDENWEKRWLATFLLGDLKAIQAEGALESIAKNDPDEFVKSYANWALEVFKKSK